MNKYYVKIPYSYVRYGTLSCYVYGENEEEAMDSAYECENRYSEDYDDGDDSGDTEYDYSGMDVELEEEDVVVPHDSRVNILQSSKIKIPAYFLAEINQL
jgi:hypothetical protein